MESVICENHSKSLTDQDFKKIINECDRSLQLSILERERILRNPVARFLAGIPFISGEAYPDVLAAMNINTYITGARNRDFFAYRRKESIKERVTPYIHSINGNREVVEFCKVILEEVSLLDHNNDKEDDLKENHPNPINDGIIDFNLEKLRIENEKNEYTTEIRELVESTFKTEVLSAWWTPF